VVGKEHPDYTVCLNNLANIFRRRGDYKAAEEYYTEAKDINEKAYGKLNERYGRGVLFLADVNTYMGNYEIAESLYLEAKQIFEQVIGKEHPDYYHTIKNLIYLYWAEGKFDLAKPYVLEASEIGKNTLAKLTRHLSEREISANIAKFEDWMNYDFSSAHIRSELIPVCYNDLLFYKGFLLNDALQVSNFVRKDETTTEKYDLLKALHRRLAAEHSKPLNSRINLAELENQANELEKELARTVAGFGESFQQVIWQEVQRTLQPGETAIEFVRYRLVNRRPTDTIMYAALVLLPGGQEPAFIPLFEERELNKLFETNGRLKPDFIKDLYSSSDLYRLLWQPLEQVLAEAQTIYFSPGGLLHRLNFGAVPMPSLLRGEASGSTLADRYRLIELGSTRQLVVPLSTKPKGGEALLYGGIQYEMDSAAIAAAISTLGSESVAIRRGLDFANADSTLRDGQWGYLRWTDVEVSSAQEMLAEAGISPTVRKGYYGTEESFKTIGANGPSPRVLHLATHGFFFPDPDTGGRQQAVAGSQGEPVFKVSDHPMIRAGLVLAGGNHAWQTGQPFRPDREDGILTAYEISQMNLSNTELVVLSACETGLGDIQGNEGVYGLQRAFKIAGAKYLIMSLWQVPDFQTQELMTSFYSLWLEDKMPIPDAFRAAQKAMKAKYKSPFLWAGFVLVE
jgi:CHAT domain-containing protein